MIFTHGSVRLLKKFNMIDVTFILLLIIFTLSIFYLFSKGTVIEFNPNRGSVWSLLLYQMLALVLMPLILLNFYGASQFSSVLSHVKDEDVFWISLLVLYATFFFLITLAIFLKFLKVPFQIELKKGVLESTELKVFVNTFIFCALGLLIFSQIFLGYKHAFIEAIVTGRNILNIRLENTYQSKLPSQIAYLINLSYIISSIFSGVLIVLKKYKKSIFYLLLALLFASAGGGKAPVFTAITICFISYMSLTGLKISIKKVMFSTLIYFPTLYIFLFSIVSLQIPDLNFKEFNLYLIGRVGVGQMAGTFETFSIAPIEGDFYLHAIPFSRIFFDYIPYDKALMMYTEGFGFSEMGVKNSFFISEAFGMGGSYLVLVSPFIVGLSYAIGIKLNYIFLQKMFSESVALIFTLPLYLMSSNITGGFSSFLFLKGLIQNFILLLVVWIFYYFFIRISINRKIITITNR